MIVDQKAPWCSAERSAVLMPAGFICRVGPLALVSLGQDGCPAARAAPAWAQLGPALVAGTVPDGLAGPGQAGTRTRHRLRDALARAVSVYVEPRSRWTTPLVLARTRAWRELAATRGPQERLNALHPTIRCHGSVLEVELGSGLR